MAGLVDGAVGADFAGGHLGVAGGGGAGEAVALPVAGGLHAGADSGGGLTPVCSRSEVAVADAGHLDLEVDAVEERPGDAAAVADDLVGLADAGAVAAAGVAAGAGVHAADQHDGGGIDDGDEAARDGDAPLFERLAHDLEGVAAELGELVEEEDAVVGEGDLAGSRHT